MVVIIMTALAFLAGYLLAKSVKAKSVEVANKYAALGMTCFIIALALVFV